jgi:hypothetical protein
MNLGLRNECIIDTPFFHSGGSILSSLLLSRVCSRPPVDSALALVELLSTMRPSFLVPRPPSLCLTHLSYHLMSWITSPPEQPLP